MSDELVVGIELIGAQAAIEQLNSIAVSIKALPARIQLFNKSALDNLSRAEYLVDKIASKSASIKGINVAVSSSRTPASVVQSASSNAAANYKAIQSAVSSAAPTASMSSGGGGGIGFGGALRLGNAVARGGGGVRGIAALGKMGPIAIAAGAGLIAFASALHGAYEKLLEFTAARIGSGGSFGEMNQAGAIGSFLGIGAGGMASMARDFQRELGGAMGGALGATLGVSDPGGAHPLSAKTDAMTNLLHAAESIRSMSDEQAKRAVMLSPGVLGPLAALRDLDPETFKALKASMEELGTPENVATAARFRATMAIFVNGLEIAAIKIFRALEIIWDYISGVLKWIFSMNTSSGFMPNGGSSKAEKAAEALEKNADATRENTDALLQHMNGMRNYFGPGTMGQNAMPNNMRGMALNKALSMDALKLGALG